MYGLLDWQTDRHCKLLTLTVTHWDTDERKSLISPKKPKRNKRQNKEKEGKRSSYKYLQLRLVFIATSSSLFLYFFSQILIVLTLHFHACNKNRQAFFFEYISYCSAVTDCMRYRRCREKEKKKERERERVYLQHTKHFLSSKKNAI